MFLYGEKAAFAANMYDSLLTLSSVGNEEIDGMRLLQMLSGLMVETLLLFDDPDEGLEVSYIKLADMFGCEPKNCLLGRSVLPPAYVLDVETEKGRNMAKTLFEDWQNCAYDFHDLVLFCVHHLVLRMERTGQSRADLFRLFIEISNRCMGYELAAQELCDIVLDVSIKGVKGDDSIGEMWSLSQSVSALGATAGRNLAMSMDMCEIFDGPAFPEKLDQLAAVMTQEATRLGVPVGSDWRFGLAANDFLTSAPYELIETLEPNCERLFMLLGFDQLLDQAVCLSKATGRMLAVTSAGDDPSIDPVIAKPLAMGAMTDTYKTICRQKSAYAFGAE